MLVPGLGRDRLRIARYRRHGRRETPGLLPAREQDQRERDRYASGDHPGTREQPASPPAKVARLARAGRRA
jgi:hypothetical protein